LIPRLCFMSDGPRSSGGRPLLDVIEALARGGVELVVLRERDWSGADWTEAARRLEAAAHARPARRGRPPLDCARALDLDGVHLGAEAVPVAEGARVPGRGRAGQPPRTTPRARAARARRELRHALARLRHRIQARRYGARRGLAARGDARSPAGARAGGLSASRVAGAGRSARRRRRRCARRRGRSGPPAEFRAALADERSR
jgi:hypothetical protein